MLAEITTFLRENLSAINEDGTSNKFTAIIKDANTIAIPIGVCSLSSIKAENIPIIGTDIIKNRNKNSVATILNIFYVYISGL